MAQKWADSTVKRVLLKNGCKAPLRPHGAEPCLRHPASTGNPSGKPSVDPALSAGPGEGLSAAPCLQLGLPRGSRQLPGCWMLTWWPFPPCCLPEAAVVSLAPGVSACRLAHSGQYTWGRISPGAEACDPGGPTLGSRVSKVLAWRDLPFVHPHHLHTRGLARGCGRFRRASTAGHTHPSQVGGVGSSSRPQTPDPDGTHVPRS